MTMTHLQQALPHYDVNEVHAIDIRATPEQVYRAVTGYSMSASPVVKVLFGLRKLPLWFTAQGRAVSQGVRHQPEVGFIESLNQGGFVKVAEVVNQEIVVGLIGKFWQLAPPVARVTDGEMFLRFADPAYAKAAMNILLTSSANGLTRLSTETRVSVPDPASRRKFRFYWALIGPFSGVIRMDMLGRIKHLAEGLT